MEYEKVNLLPIVERSLRDFVARFPSSVRYPKAQQLLDNIEKAELERRQLAVTQEMIKRLEDLERAQKQQRAQEADKNGVEADRQRVAIEQKRRDEERKQAELEQQKRKDEETRKQAEVEQQKRKDEETRKQAELTKQRIEASRMGIGATSQDVNVR